MTSENPLVLSMKIPESLKERAREEAKREGKGRTAEAWLESQAEKFLQRVAAKDDDLKPKEAAKLLGVGLWTLRRLMAAGEFPNRYYVNPRVLRIPMADVQSYRQSRKVSLD